MRLLVLALIASVAAFGCGGSGGSGSPTAPSAPQTKVIGVSGNLAFGDVLVGASLNAPFTVSNSGTAPLVVSGLTGPSGFTASWQSGSIAAGASQTVQVGFSPTAPGVYGGTITVNADQTAGTNTIPVSGTAFANMNGGWSGTTVTSGAGLSGTCVMSWILSGQTASTFSGTWQTSGANCGQAGTLGGTISPENSITNLSVVATVAPSTCTRVSGDGKFNGTLSNGTLTAQMTDVVRCPGLADLARSMTLTMRKQ